MSQNLINSLSLSSGLLAYSLILCGILLVVAIKNFKSMGLMFGLSLVVVIAVYVFHYNNKKQLHSWIKEMTCDKMNIDKNKRCNIITVPMREVIVTVSQDNELKLDEKFFYELEKQPVKQVAFYIAEKCDFAFFCKYSYEQFIYEFDVNKTQINEYLNSNQDQKIYFNSGTK